MPNATASLAFFSLVVLTQGQKTRIIWPESEPRDTSEYKPQETQPSRPQDTYSSYVDEDGMEVVEVFGGETQASPASLAVSTPPQIPDGADKKSDSLYDADEEEMDNLISRMKTFRTRVEKAQTSTSKDAVLSRFFAGLDDDDEGDDAHEEGSDGSQVPLKLTAEQLIEIMQTGKLPEGVADLLGKDDNDASVDLDSAVPKSKEVERKDPPAVITGYYDQVDQKKDEKNHMPLLNRFNFHNNVMTRRDDEVENWIIRFCHEWYSPCSRMLPAFKKLAYETEKQLNQDSLKTVVRFAEVDCSTDKPLCNEQGAETYPKLIHYHRGIQLGEWEGASGRDTDVKDMNKWMEGQSKKILQKRSNTASARVQDKTRKSDGLITETWDAADASWWFSLVAMVTALLGHVWLVRVRTHGACKLASKAPAKESCKDSQQPSKPVEVLGPSGLGSMLPEEWVCKASGQDLMEL